MTLRSLSYMKLLRAYHFAVQKKYHLHIVLCHLSSVLLCIFNYCSHFMLTVRKVSLFYCSSLIWMRKALTILCCNSAFALFFLFLLTPAICLPLNRGLEVPFLSVSSVFSIVPDSSRHQQNYT